jgi:signal transduction histidine kinase
MDALHLTDEGSIYLYDSQRVSLCHQVSLGLTPWFGLFPEFQPGEGIIGLAFQQKDKVISRDVNELDRYLQGLNQANLEVMVQSLATSPAPSYALAVPLRWGEEVLGVLLLTRHSGDHGLDAGEIALVEAFARYMALVVSQSQLIQQSRKADRDMRLQRQFQPLLTNLHSQVGFQELFIHLKGQVPFDCARIMLANSEGIRPDPGHFWCPGNLEVDKVAVDRYLKGMFREVVAHAQNGGTAISAHEDLWGPSLANSWERWPVPPELASGGVCSIAGVIMQTCPRPSHLQGEEGKGELLGGMVLLHREAGFYARQHMELLQTLNPYLVPLVASAALSSKLAKKMRNIDWLRKMVSLASTAGSFDEMVRNLLEWTADQLDMETLDDQTAGHQCTVFVILVDKDKGTFNITWAAPDEPGGLRRQRGGTAISEVNSLLQQIDALEMEDGTALIPSDSPLTRQIKQLVGTTRESRVIIFPLSVNGKPHGLLGIELPVNYQLDEGQKSSIQQLAAIAAISLQSNRLYEAQARHTREMQHQDELRRSFLAFIMHEFRTPLTSLKTSFELVLESGMGRGLSEPYQRLLSNINRSIAVLEQLVHDLSEVANVSTGSILLNKAQTTAEAIVYSVVEMTAPLTHMKNQSLEVEISPELPNFMADSHRLEQVLTNLVSNAIKYAPSGSTVRLAVSQDNGSIKFAVSDNGIGIPPEYLDQLFQPFFRVPGGTVERSYGSGLGLALAKSLVELHQGKIWVESEPGKGSTFYFTIPTGAGLP